MFESINYDDLKYISSEEIFRRYCTPFKTINKSFSSELREDPTPSCRITPIRGDLLYKDFGNPDHSFRAVNYVMNKYNLTYIEAVELIVKDIRPKYHKKVKTLPEIKSKETFIRIKSREFNNLELDFWNSFYWNKFMLEESKTKAIDAYQIDDRFFNVTDELCFSYDYYISKGIMRRKIYHPNRHEYKWFSNSDDTIVQLVDVMPKFGDILFITSSKKDSGIFWRIQLEKMFPDIVIHGVAPNCETVFVPENWLEKQRSRYKRIVIYYDNDFDKENNPGVKDAKKFAEKYNLEFFYTPNNTKKDPSDFSKAYGILDFKQLIQTQLNLK